MTTCICDIDYGEYMVVSFTGDMWRLMAVLACLGALEAAFLQSLKQEPATISLPLTEVLAGVSGVTSLVAASM